MIIKILKKLYKYIEFPIVYLLEIDFGLFNYYFPNWKKIATERIILGGETPKCKQKTLVTGSGKVIFSGLCTFGSVQGGYFRNGAIEIQPRYTNSVIKFGSNITSNNNLFVCAANSIEIGSNTLIGHFVSIRDHDAHSINPKKRLEIGVVGKVIIGENVWVGNNVQILKNSVIGNNSIIAAGAVVAGVFPPNVIIGGVPAKIIKIIE